MIRKILIAGLFLSLNLSFAKAKCSVVFENSGPTCLAVHSLLTSEITSFVQTFKGKRSTDIEAPTRELSDLMEKYNYLTSYYYSITNIINALNLNIAMSQKEIAFYNEKEFNIKKVRSDLEALNNSLDILLNEIELNNAK